MKDTVNVMSETDSNQNANNNNGGGVNVNVQPRETASASSSFASNGHLSPTNSLTNGTNSDHSSVSSSPGLCSSSQSSQMADTPTGALPAMVTPTDAPTGDTSTPPPPPQIITNGPCASDGPVPQGPPSPSNQQHIVHVHVNAGETFSVRVGDQIQQIHGPATVRMVSSNGPPLPMPMTVPAGHMVQQIVDERGILTHVILSQQPPAMPNNSTGLTVGYYGGPANGAQYYPAAYPGHYPSHPQYTTHHTHGTGGTTTHVHQGVPPPQSHIHGTPPPQAHSHTAVHPTGPATPVNHHGDDRAIRQRVKLKSRYDKRVKEGYYHGPPPRRTKNNKANGDIESCGRTHRPHSPAERQRELEEERHVITRQLSLMPEPKVTEVDSRSALILLEAPDYDSTQFSIDVAEFRYELLLSEKGRDAKYKLVYKGDATEITLKDLKPATEYFLRVSTLLDDLKGEPTETVSFKTSVCEPDTPLAPKLTSKTKTSIQLKWASTPDNGSKVTKFILEYDKGLNEGAFTEVVSGLNKTFRLTKLQPSTQYFFRLCAVNGIGKSEYCDSVAFWTSGTVPSQTDPPMLSEQNITSMTMSWIKRPLDDDFVLQMEDVSTGHGFIPEFHGPQLSHTIKNLRRNTSYRFRLSAKNEEGQSKWSDVMDYSTLPDLPAPPSKPQLKGKIHSSSFRVCWDAPKDTGGSDIESYTLELDDGQGFESVYEGPDREHVCDRLQPGHAYRLRCCSCTSAGKSDYSDCCALTTLSVAPGQCPSPKLQGKAKATSLHLRWNYPQYDGGTTVTEFGVQMVLPDNTTREVYRGRELDCIVAGLSPGRPYLFQVRAFNKAGGGSWSESLEVVSGPGVPDAPKAPMLSCRSPHVTSISWEEPVNNGASITEYRLDWSQRTDHEFIQLYTGSSKSYDLKGLTPAAQYAFRVQAINSAGPGPFSHTAVCVTPPSSPSQVVSVRCTATTATIAFQWSPPASNGSDITQYNIDMGDKSVVAVCGGLSEHTVSDLTPDTTYRVRVQAVNAIGDGAYSSYIKVTTKCLPPNPPRLECVSVLPNSIKVKWGDGKNPDLLRYTLEMERDDGNFVALYTGPAHTFKVNKLSELSAYEFRIFASNEAGEGPYSDLFTFSTPKATPAPLKPPTVCHIGLTQCNVEWQTCRPMGQDSIEYILQLQSPTISQEFIKVYQGSATSFRLSTLTPKTEYRVRVCAVRLCSDDHNLCGPYSAGTPFATVSPEPARVVAAVASEPTKSAAPRQLTDQQWAMIILCGFAVFAVLFAVVAQQIISYVYDAPRP